MSTAAVWGDTQSYPCPSSKDLCPQQQGGLGWAVDNLVGHCRQVIIPILGN